MRTRPGDVFLSLAADMAPGRNNSYKGREHAMSLGDLLRSEADARGERGRDDLADRLTRGAREAAAKGLSLQATIDVMTMLDPFGTAVPDDIRRMLWLELSRGR